MRLYLFLGLMLIFLAFWKGDGGYLDLREYLDDAERLALKGDMRLPAEPGAPAQYNRYSIGLPFVSAPMAWIGAALEQISGGAIGRRAIIALTVPLLSALFGVVLFEIARALNFSPRIALVSAIVASLGSPHLTYSRLFFAEAGIELGVLLGVWGYLKARSHAPAYLIAAGAGIAMAGASHYPHAFVVGALWAALASGLWFTNQTFSQRARSIAFFALVPVLAVCGIAAMNFSRYGQLVPARYQVETDSNMALRFIADNAHLLGRMLLRTIWFLPALVFGAVTLWRGSRPLVGRERFLAAGICAGVVLQTLFWLTYNQLYMFSTRYFHPVSALAAVGLPVLLWWINERFPRRGLVYATLILLLSNAAQFSRDTIFQPFLEAPSSLDGILAYVWYMAPAPAGWKFDGGTPAGLTQWLMLFVLLGAGTVLLWKAARQARLSESGG